MFLGLAGCASPVPIETTSGLRTVPSETAFAMPDPGGPTITSVTQEQLANTVEQRIYLETDASVPGQNYILVQLFGPRDARLGTQNGVAEGFRADLKWRSEARGAIPGVSMNLSPYYVQNRYGPFGYAMGRSRGGDLCMYAWQTLSSTNSTRTLFREKGAIRIRMRVCRAGSSEANLLNLMYNFTLNAFYRDRHWNPYGATLPPAAGLGRPGSAIYPTGETGFNNVAPLAPGRAASGAPRRVSRPAAQRAAPPATIEPQPLPQPIGPLVPPPPGQQPIRATPAQSSPRQSPDLVQPARQIPLAPAPAVTVPAPSTIVPPPPAGSPPDPAAPERN
ncbi:MAG: cellulose biosynthesis protein BcsN [Methylobacterium mesophilicum]|nr:cellulose biosynthesis protein BcsN [Methylobacterium mesophilicum]